MEWFLFQKNAIARRQFRGRAINWPHHCFLKAEKLQSEPRKIQLPILGSAQYNPINVAKPLNPCSMNVVLQFTLQEEAKALPILMRHSPGMVFRDRTYVVDRSVAQGLRDAAIPFREVQPQPNLPAVEKHKADRIQEEILIVERDVKSL